MDKKISALDDSAALTGDEFIVLVQPTTGPKGNVKITIDSLMTFAPVQSVNGQIGPVVLDADDIGALEAGDNISLLTNDAGYLTSGGNVSFQTIVITTPVADASFATSTLLVRDAAGNIDKIAASGGGTTNFLRADGSWAAPSGSGNVSNTGTPLNDQIAVWTNSTTIEGTAGLGYSIVSTEARLSINGGGVATNAQLALFGTNGYIYGADGTGTGTTIEIKSGDGITNGNGGGLILKAGTKAGGGTSATMTFYTHNTLRLTIAADGSFTFGSNVGGGGTTNFLRADGSWAAPSGSGNVSNTGTPANNQIAIWTDSTTIEGVSAVTFDGTVFQVTGDIRIVSGALGVGVAASATDGRIDASNEILSFSSDKRLKTNVELIKNSLDRVKLLTGFTYNWNDLAGRVAGYNMKQRHVGVYAQDVIAVQPEAVRLAPFDNDGRDESISGEDYLTVQYDKLVPLLIEAIKELTNKVEKLEEYAPAI